VGDTKLESDSVGKQVREEIDLGEEKKNSSDDEQERP